MLFILIATVENFIYDSAELKGGLGNSIRRLSENPGKCFYRCLNIGESLPSCRSIKQCFINSLGAEIHESAWIMAQI
jgi:hypothetical protein